MTHPKVQSAACFTLSAIESAESFYRASAPKVQDAYFVAAPIVRDAYNATQLWIKEEAPAIEAQIKRAALKSVIAFLEFALVVIDFALEQKSQVPVYVLQIKLAVNKAKQYRVRHQIAVQSFISYNGIDTKIERGLGRVSAVWNSRDEVARSIFDRLFCLGA